MFESIVTTKKKKKSPMVFNNPQVNVIDSFDCYVPPRLEHVMRSANSHLDSTEFSFFIKCNIDWENRIVEVLDGDEDIFFPKQTVSSAKVDYEEDNEDFNGVIHKHPDNMKSFSTTDAKYINSNFTVSLLWTATTGLCNGIINIPIQAGNVQLGLNIIEEVDDDLDQNIIEIVKEKATVESLYQSHKYNKNSSYFGKTRRDEDYRSSFNIRGGYTWKDGEYVWNDNDDEDFDIVDNDQLVDLESGKDDKTNIFLQGDLEND